MSKQTIVYKVLARSPDMGLISTGFPGLRFHPDYKWAVLHYAPGWTTTPKRPGAKLFAFADKADALEYAGGGLLVYEAEAEGVTEARGPWGIIPLNPEDFESYWSNRGARYNASGTMLLPSGTVFCDSITLTKRVK